MIAKLALFLGEVLHRCFSIKQQLQQIFIHMLNIKQSKHDLPRAAAVSVDSKPDTHTLLPCFPFSLWYAFVSSLFAAAVRLWNQATSSFLSANICISFHLSAVKLLQGRTAAAAAALLVSERAAWHRAFPADIGEDCSSWSPRCWNPRKSCLFFFTTMDGQKQSALDNCRTHSRNCTG